MKAMWIEVPLREVAGDQSQICDSCWGSNTCGAQCLGKMYTVRNSRMREFKRVWT